MKKAKKASAGELSLPDTNLIDFELNPEFNESEFVALNDLTVEDASFQIRFNKT